MKKLLLVVALVLVSVFALTGCQNTVDYSIKPVNKEDLKIGVICLHGEESTYDANFINAVKEAVAEMYGEENVNDHLEIKTGIAEDASCEDAANELAKTCDIVFADSFGHESFIINAASKNPSVRFCHATGTKANTTSLANFSNAFASIYEGRYLAGYAAGLKLNLMKNENPSMVATIGYVGAFPYAEVVSGYTAFYLGVKASYTGDDLTMKVRYTSSWYDYDAEYAAANALINDGCVLISQHADSMGAPTACKEKGVPNVTYNIETGDTTPNTYLAYSRINWAPYFTYIMECTIAGVRIDANYTGTLLSGSVEYNVTNSTALWGDALTAALNVGLVEAKALEIKAGLVKVFDVDTFTVNGNKVTEEQLADVNDFGDYVAETKVVIGGEYKESYYRSAPYFDLRIDGITEVEDK